MKRQEYEVKLLDFIETEFVFQDGSENRTDGNATEVKIFVYLNDLFSYTTSSHCGSIGKVL